MPRQISRNQRAGAGGELQTRRSGGESAPRPAGRWWSGLAARSTLFVGALLAALALILISISAARLRDVAEAAVERTLLARADEIAVLLDGKAGDRDMLAGLREPALAYVYVARPSGVVVAGAAPAAAPPASARTDIPTALRADGLAHAAAPVRLADGSAATLRIGASLASAAADTRDLVVRGLIAALGFLALALPFLALLADRVAAPLRALARAIMRPGTASEAVRAAGRRRDEVGALARAHLSIARELADNANALHRATFDDPVTALPNRAGLGIRLAEALQLKEGAALLKLDIEGLTEVAVGLGQTHGDEALRRAAARLTEVVSAARAKADGPAAGDEIILARGSDHGFALLARGADAGVARALADAALKAFERPIEVGEDLVFASLAIGVALAPADGEEAGALLRSAAAAAAAARAAGPGTLRFAGAELTDLAYVRLKLEQDLRRAFDRGELELHYQPQLHLKSGKASGAEALIRWRHPTRGLISPAEFVPLAEDCGLIDRLGRFTLATASRAVADWTARGLDLTVAVNVSAIEFQRPDFAVSALKTIRDAGADPARIELEITESAAMGDPVHAARELAPLKTEGVRIAIDDFGTGYSNLSALTRLPIDVLKIDRSFIRNAKAEAGARVVVGALVGLAENLGFETVAEGVETADDLVFVTSQGVTHVQGYLFGKPMTAGAFEAWWSERLIAELRGVRTRGAPVGDAAVARA